MYIPQLTHQRFLYNTNTKKNKMPGHGSGGRFEQTNLLSQNNKSTSMENIKRASSFQKKTKRFQLLVYTFLERPSGWLAGMYQLFMYVALECQVVLKIQHYFLLTLFLNRFVFALYLTLTSSFGTVLICLILSVLVTIPQYDVIASNILMQAVSVFDLIVSTYCAVHLKKKKLTFFNVKN